MTASRNHLEVEVKFHINQPETAVQNLTRIGAVAQPRVFETNLRFEDRGHTLKASHKLLRLRQDKACRLTYKSKPPQSDSQCKVYRELEVEVVDFDTMRAILQELGYHTAQIYEKWRQVWRWKDVEICLDTMPYGTFLEIEGPQESIKSTAGRLHLSWKKRILENYLAMFEALRTHYYLPFKDVTFSNFKNCCADISPIIKRFEAGK
ncbi:MAG: class IV adenylate cyclase [Desulfobacteraceae bacterium]|jgi:adenylate cyclase class 2